MIQKSIHHSFDIDLARRYGVHGAILLHHFQHWISFNQRLKKNFIEGRTWTYQSRRDIAAHLPYLSEKEIRGAIDRLTEEGVLLKGNFNKTPFDRTTWFAFVDESLFSNNVYDVPKGPMERSNGPMEGSKGPMGGGSVLSMKNDAAVYTDTKTDSKEREEKRASAPPPPKKKEKKKFLEAVDLTEDEHAKLVLDLGQEATGKWIQALNDYILSKGSKYQSHYQTILNWIKREGPRAAPGAARPSEQVIAKRKSMAAQCDMGKVNGFDVSASKEYVEFSKGSFSRQLRYDASKEAWEETTGWKD